MNKQQEKNCDRATSLSYLASLDRAERPTQEVYCGQSHLVSQQPDTAGIWKTPRWPGVLAKGIG